MERNRELEVKRAMNTGLVGNVHRGTESEHVLMMVCKHSRRITDGLFTVGDREYLLFLIKYLYTYRSSSIVIIVKLAIFGNIPSLTIIFTSLLFKQ